MSKSSSPQELSQHVNALTVMGTASDPHEYQLIENWRTQTDERSLKRLLDNHEKLIKMVANGYRGYGLPLEELIAEGVDVNEPSINNTMDNTNEEATLLN